jgi:hypothetical protein
MAKDSVRRRRDRTKDSGYVWLTKVGFGKVERCESFGCSSDRDELWLGGYPSQISALKKFHTAQTCASVVLHDVQLKPPRNSHGKVILTAIKVVVEK